MQSSFVQLQVRRANRNLMLISVIGILVLIAIAAFSSRYLYNFFLGPFKVDQQTLIDTADPSSLRQYWVTVEGDDVVETGYQMVETDKYGHETVESEYMALLLQDRLLIVQAPDTQTKTTFTGDLEAMPSDLSSKIAEDIAQEAPDLKDVLLPYMLNTDNFRLPGYIGLAICIPLFGLLVWHLIRSIARSNDPLTHPIMKGLGRFGPADYVASQIDAELMLDHTQMGAVHLTPNWLVSGKAGAFKATRISDIVWGYKQVTQHRTNGIPTGKTYAAQLWDRHGMQISITGKEKFVNQVLEAAYQQAPWMIAGHSADLEKAWKKDRAGLIAAVDQRRLQGTAQ